MCQCGILGCVNFGLFTLSDIIVIFAVYNVWSFQPLELIVVLQILHSNSFRNLMLFFNSS